MVEDTNATTSVWYDVNANLVRGTWNVISIPVAASAVLPIKEIGVRFNNSWYATAYLDTVTF